MIVTVFDFDDTLFATTHLQQLEIKTVKFPKLSKSICTLIDIALEKGHVYIITNGNHEWVQQCIRDNLINCEHILDRIHLLSTIDSGICNIASVKLRKITAFDRISGLFRSRGNHHLICFGDSIYDRKASNHIRYKIGSNTYVKNVKFHINPTLNQILLQHKNILIIYPTLLMTEQHLDLELRQPSFLPSTMQYLSSSSSSEDDLEDEDDDTGDDGKDVTDETNI